MNPTPRLDENMNDEPWATNWKLLSGLSSGGQGKTSKVCRVSDSNSVGVLKTLRANNAHMPKSRARMAQEVIALDALTTYKAKVPAVLEHNTADHKNRKTTLFVVMEYIP